MHIAIILTTYNRKELLQKTLLKIKGLIIPRNVITSIIVIEDGCTDATAQMLKEEFAGIIVIHTEGNYFWTKCMNLGFRKAVEINSTFVLILNDDIEIEENYLSNLLNDYSKLPAESILGSASISKSVPHKVESGGTKDFIKWRLKFKPYFKGFTKVDENFNGIHKSWTLSGRGTLIPCSLFEKIGYYDENLIQYGSDDEFCLRANINKIPVYITWNARILNHTNSTSVGSAFKKEGLMILLKSFFNKYSVNSLSKNIYLYNKYSYKLLTPIYVLYLIVGTIKAYYFNYKND